MDFPQLFENVKVQVLTRGPDHSPNNLIQEFKGAIAIESSVNLFDYAMFPAMNYSVARNDFPLTLVPKQARKKVQKLIQQGKQPSKEAPTFLGDVLVLDGSAPINVIPEEKIVAIESNTPKQRERGVLPIHDSAFVLIQFSKADDYHAFHGLMDKVMNNGMPKCRKCGYRKYFNPMHNVNPQPWRHEHVCAHCLEVYCQFGDMLKEVFMNPNLARDQGPQFFMNLIKQLAEGMEDDLVTANVLLMESMFQMVHGNLDGSIGNQEKVKDLLSRFEDFNDEVFFPSMERLYDQCLFLLAQNYRITKRFDDMVPLLQESLKMDQRSGEKMNEAKTRGNLGTAYLELGRLEDAEKEFTLSLQIRKSHGDRSSGTALVLLGMLRTLIKKNDVAALKPIYTELSSTYKDLVLKMEGGAEAMEQASKLI
ncbi:MAG: tetratricopeptide repeat protein [Candidatus Hodarchaeota archaeon]